MRRLISAFFWSTRWLLRAWGGLFTLIASLNMQVYLSVLINQWNQRFFDQFKGGSLSVFWEEALVGFSLMCLEALLIVWVNWVTRHYAFWWRKAITFSYIPKYLNVKEDVEGSSQRLQECAYGLTLGLESIGLQAVKSVMTLIAFLPVLWALSEGIVIRLKDWPVPYLETAEGNLVWLAVAVTILGMLFSWLTGYKLPELQYKKQKLEATFRKVLVLAEDNKFINALPRAIAESFFGLEYNYQRIFLNQGYLDTWTAWYERMISFLPLVVVGPSVVVGVIGFGVFMQIINAFGWVHSSMSLLIKNWPLITELHSMYKRLKELEKSINKQNEGVPKSVLVKKEDELYEFRFTATISDRIIDWCYRRPLGYFTWTVVWLLQFISLRKY